VIGLLLLPIVLFLLVRWFEYSTTFQPSRNVYAQASELGQPVEETFINSGSERLHVWFFPAQTDALHTNKVFLVTHGNAGNITHRLDLAETLLDAGGAVLLLEYRGYGQSTGRPSESGFYQDAAAAYDFLLAKGFTATNIIAFGESLGGAVAAQLAAMKPTGGLILLSTFTSLPDLGSELFPWIPRFLGSLRFNTLERIPKVNVPILIIHSRADTIIPFHHGEKLHAAALEPKMLVEIDADHNDTFVDEQEAVTKAVEKFLKP
jgi:fermentation-respiration switch protein FrsA (DUF1100 family)